MIDTTKKNFPEQIECEGTIWKWRHRCPKCGYGEFAIYNQEEWWIELVVCLHCGNKEDWTR